MKMDISHAALEGLQEAVSQEAVSQVAERYDMRTDTQKLCQYIFRHPLQAVGTPLWLIGRWHKMRWCK